MKNDWIKFYGEHDLSTDIYFSKIETFIINFISNSTITTLNEAIELYNILKFTSLDCFKEKPFECIDDFKTKAHVLLNGYFNKGSLLEYISEYDDLYFQYEQDFWDVFVSYKIIKKTDSSEFQKCIEEKEIPIQYLLEQQKISDKYKVLIKEKLLSNPKSFELFIDKYDSPNNQNIYLPSNFSDEEITNWARRYCELEEANINYLDKISNWSSHHGYKFDTRIIAKAKKMKANQTEKFFSVKQGISWKIEIAFKDGIKNDFEFSEKNARSFEILFDKNWVENEQDYPTILNNFIYFIGLFNPFFQFSLIESPYESGGLIDLLQPKSLYSYKQSYLFQLNRDFSKLSLLGYFDYLSYLKIDLEEVFAFYYCELLDKEYGYPDFFFSPSSKHNNYYERCKILIPELDSILKQFDFIQRYGEIDADVFELDSKNIDYRYIKSLSDKKFIYFDSSEILDFCRLIFNSQSKLAFPEKKKNKKNFFEYVKNGISVDDFHDYQKRIIKSLIHKDILYINVMNQICFTNPSSVNLYYLLWEKGYLSTLYMPETVLELIEEELRLGHIKYGNTLFSEQEIDYISFVMDNKKFSNGLAVRNKIIHGSFGRKPKSEHKECYLELLMILVLFTVRINEELDFNAKKTKSNENDTV
ncbi:hypothetical protein [Enterococcus faecalis]|uniref:hypothetical protein n=2 Tax=Enterococcus TaxID=1350 RepID=UPI000667E3C8|nr:hypothetical protein [Enterococcus faecalis]MDU7414526.1 hypothetical protein [Varibaculum cambriense]MCD5047662.1 hypothetical protein [Enterococcus faecalis]MCU2219513.1 hypothetical protein [Enterococcus faecalis]MDN3106468.1 hypothetical protein [Enterococcus faecalis]MDN3121741.1 hypothetical protein [Enterococcus faecalis]